MLNYVLMWEINIKDNIESIFSSIKIIIVNLNSCIQHL